MYFKLIARNATNLTRQTMLFGLLRSSVPSRPSVTKPKCHYSSSNKQTSPIYELRIYQSLPKDFPTLNAIFNEQMGMRTKHSKLVGFWVSEVGETIQQVVHLWEYDNLSHRAKVRAALLHDFRLQINYMSRVMPLMTHMKNHLVLPAPNTSIDQSFSPDPKAVYVLQTVTSASKQTAPTPDNKNNEQLVAHLTSVLGPGNSEFRLWRYSDIDSVTECCLNRALDSPTKGSSLLMYPSPFSAMK